jgi:hypothetical protein
MIKDDTGQRLIQRSCGQACRTSPPPDDAFLVQSFTVSFLSSGVSWLIYSARNQFAMIHNVENRLRFHDIFIRKSRQR